MSGASYRTAGDKCTQMQFAGGQLEEILNGQNQEVEVYDSDGFLRGQVRPRIAVRIASAGNYVGVGNRRRIHYLRPLNGAFDIRRLHDASRTTRRVRNDQDQFVGGPWVREHKPVAV